MYPHLADLLELLRRRFEEVVYLSCDDRGEGLYRLDAFVDTVLKRTGLRRQEGVPAVTAPSYRSGSLLGAAVAGFASACRGTVAFLRNCAEVQRAVREIERSREKVVLIAIDHTAFFAVSRAAQSPVLFWSFDALTPDARWRVPGGLLDRLLRRGGERTAAALIVQDAPRRDMVERTVAHRFDRVVFLPVGVKDGAFERGAASSRSAGGERARLEVLQNGWIAAIRWSCELIEASQNWPARYRLSLHGHLSAEDPVNGVLGSAGRPPGFSSEMYAGEELSRFLDRYDVGFIGYQETDNNHRNLEHASLQMVLFLRLGIPVVCCGPRPLCDFVEAQGIGTAVSHPSEMREALDRLSCGYGAYSRKARLLFEDRFDVESRATVALIPVLRELLR